MKCEYIHFLYIYCLKVCISCYDCCFENVTLRNRQIGVAGSFTVQCFQYPRSSLYSIDLQKKKPEEILVMEHERHISHCTGLDPEVP